MQNDKDYSDVFKTIVDSRRSIRVFDSEVSFNDSVVEYAIDQALLAPNSSNLQLWEFYRIKSFEAKKIIAEYCLNQPAAKTAREMVVIVTRLDKWRDRQHAMVNNLEKQFPSLDKPARKKNGAFWYYETIIPALYSSKLGFFSDWLKKWTVNLRGLKRPTPREVTHQDLRISVHRSAALAAQNLMMAIKASGFDSCPMEGHDSKRILKFLNLPKGAEINMVIGVGPGRKEGLYGPRFRVSKNEVVFEI